MENFCVIFVGIKITPTQATIPHHPSIKHFYFEKSPVINMIHNVIQGILGCPLIPIPVVNLCCCDCFWFALWNIYVRVVLSVFVLYFDILVWNVLRDD